MLGLHLKTHHNHLLPNHCLLFIHNHLHISIHNIKCLQLKQHLYWLHWLRYFRVFLSLSMQMIQQHLNIMITAFLCPHLLTIQDLYCPDLILHLQGHPLQYIVLWHLSLCFINGDMCCYADGLSELHYRCVTYICKRLKRCSRNPQPGTS